MKASELREKSMAELRDNLIRLMKDRFNYRMQKSTGQLTQTHRLHEVTKDIARVRTIMNEKAGTADE